MKPTYANHQAHPPKHGGNLEEAVQQYSIPRNKWIDLSSGVSPWAWPIDKLPNSVWTELPPSTKELIRSAASFYCCDLKQIIASPGSQLIARLIPQQLNASSVAIPALGYQEHRYSWQLAGHTIHYYQSVSELNTLIDAKQVEHAVVINPNNPTGELITADQINNIASKLPGLLVIDEAFMDFHQFDLRASADKSQQHNSTQRPAIESAILHPNNNQIVLRSVGKFFGLAGLRVGFAIGTHPILKNLKSILEPWSLNHASQLIATNMLKDSAWQQSQAIKIQNESKHFNNIINGFSQAVLHNFHLSNGGLFITLFANQEALQQMHTTLAKHGIWTRLHNPNDPHAWLRFSLTTQTLKCQSIFEKVINEKVINIDTMNH